MKTILTKNILLFVFLIVSFGVYADSWVQKASFPGVGRSHPFSFSIGTKGYVGGGDGMSDFWEYNSTTDMWTQKGNFPMGTSGGVGLSMNGKGYVQHSTSFYEYEPSTDIWTPKASYPISVNYASGFVIGNNLYIVGGWPATGQCYQWSASANAWSQKASLPFVRGLAVGFSIHDKGYFGTGEYGSSPYHRDIWEYDTLANTWTQKADFGGVARNDAAAFTLCDFAFVGIGGESPYYNDFWQYYPAINQWVQKASFGGAPRDDAAFFAINGKGYIGLGEYGNSTNYLDFWQYTPDHKCDPLGITILNESREVFIYPNPFHMATTLELKNVFQNTELRIYNSLGKEMRHQKITSQTITINRDGLADGIYFYEITNDKGIVTKGKLMIE